MAQIRIRNTNERIEGEEKSKPSWIVKMLFMNTGMQTSFRKHFVRNSYLVMKRKPKF